MKLSIIIPVYNEKLWVRTVVERVLQQPVSGVNSKELIIVDDGSCDGTTEIIKSLSKKYPEIIPVYMTKNAGKGASIQAAAGKITGDACIIQDADDEYDPKDYSLVLEPIISGRADAVYGSRFIGTQPKRVLFFWHYLGNLFLTRLSNMLTNLNLTDMETGCKAFRAEVLKSIPLRSRRFGFEPEITAKLSRKKCRIFEVGISYNGRTYDEGKKITWLDGFKAIFTIVKFWLVKDI